MPKLTPFKIQYHQQSAGNGGCPCVNLIADSGFSAYYTCRGENIDADSPYAGFNVCHYTGDSLEHISLCRAQLCDEFGVGADALVIPRQTHSVNVLTIDGLPVDAGKLECVDGLVTNLDNVLIGVSTADCVPVALGDSVAGVMGVAHAGWRGAVGGVVRNTVMAMLAAGADVSRIKAAFGPSICVDCFEVGEEVAMQFPPDCVERRDEWGRPHVNLQRFVSDELVGIGLKKENIAPFSQELCTLCSPEKYFSARHLGTDSGRLFTFVKRV